MSTRLFKANQDQMLALQEATESHQESQDENTKQKFIMDFLAFSNRITGDGGGYPLPIGKDLAIFHLHGTSNHMAIPTEELPNQGVELEAYKAVVGKNDYWGKRKPIGGVAVGADVKIGLIVDGTFPRLAGQETVMRVTSLPPTVYYKRDNAELTPIEPSSEAWAEMSELAESLTSREAELKSRFIKD